MKIGEFVLLVILLFAADKLNCLVFDIKILYKGMTKGFMDFTQKGRIFCLCTVHSTHLLVLLALGNTHLPWPKSFL